MKVYRVVEDFKRVSYAVVTSGIFDGVHKGHQKILQRITEIAKQSQGESVVITFWPHPRKVLHPTELPVPILTNLEEKINLISDCGIDHLLIIPFTKEFSSLSSFDFVTKILIDKIGTRKLVIGYDHKFGKNREGSFEFLKENCHQLGFEVEEISKQEVDHMAVSSTNIRNAIIEGDVRTAAQYLGRFYSISGKVVKGKQLGKQIGYPTANIEIEDSEKLIPKDGIYTVQVKIEGKMFGGMLSIGFNPTVNGNKKTIEVNIFEFDRDIYGMNIQVFFVEYLRNEEKFSSLDELIQQLHVDKDNSLQILKDKSINYKY
jgi:riboflavin kinase/FMN adenylyltransferase